MPRSRPFGVLVLGLVVLAAWAMVVGDEPSFLDDAMIVLRYARNLVEGHGWVFNPGEVVQASTSPGNTLLLAGGLGLGLEAHLCQRLVAVLALGLMAFALSWKWREGCLPVRLLACALVLAVPLWPTVIGLETLPFCACLLAAVLLHARKETVRASVFLGVSCWFRADAILMLPLLLLVELGEREDLARRCLRLALPCVAMLGAWFVLSAVLFGDPFPSTLAAKRAQGASGYWGHGTLYLRGLKQALELDGGPDVGGRAWLGRVPAVAVLIAGGLLLLLGPLLRRRAGGVVVPGAPRFVWLMAGFALLQTLAYTVLCVPYYHWYGAPVHLAIALLVVALVDFGWRLELPAGDGRPTPRRPLRWPALALGLAWLALQVPRVVAPRETPHGYRLYHAAAAWLEQQAVPGQSLACFEIGNLGWSLPALRIVDPCGLVTPEVQPALAHGDLASYLRLEPDWVVLHDPPWELERQTVDAPAFGRRWTQATRIEVGDGPALTIHRRD
ncbi:MAG: hypothetical protein R3F30_00615 [Planctomycetota bacterium]